MFIIFHLSNTFFSRYLLVKINLKLENPFSQFNDLKNSSRIKNPNQPRTQRIVNLVSDSENNNSNNDYSSEEIEPERQKIIETIKCDLIINRDFNGLGGFSEFIPAEDLKRKYEEFKISLISHFYFSIIVEKLKDSDEPLKLVLNVKDELDYVNTKKEYEIQQIDFVCQAEILNINYNQYQESIKLMEIMEKNERMKNKNEISIDNETGEEIINNLDHSNNYNEDKVNKLDYNQITDILQNLNFLKKMAKTERLKIVNVDDINKNYSLI